MAFVLPGLASIAFGLLFARIVPREHAPPAKRAPRQSDLPRSELAARRADRDAHVDVRRASSSTSRPTATASCMSDRLRAVTADPALVGALLGWSTSWHRSRN